MTADPDIAILFGRPGRNETLAEKLRARGFRVTLYNQPGVPGTYVPLDHAFFPTLRRVLSARHDIYLTPLSFIPALSLYVNRRLRGIPCVFNATGWKAATYRDRSERWRFPRLAERWAYPALMDRILSGASQIVCNSQYLQGKLETDHPRYASRMVTIYNGIDFERFASGQRASADGASPGSPRLLSVTSWNFTAKTSGGKLLIDAMEPIVKRYPESRLVIAAKIRHRRFAPEVEEHLAKKPWRDSVRVVYNQDNIPDLLASSDIFLYATPESHDSLPRALLEAHAAGLPIVTTATCGCAEIVEDAATGFAVPYDARALATRVIELLADRERARGMGLRGRERVRELFSWDRMAEAYADLFREVLSGDAEAVRTGRLVDRSVESGGRKA